MSPKALSSLILAGMLLILASQSLYVVKETQVAIKLKFGEVVESNIAPGMHVKIPFVEVIKRFDARILTLDTKPARFLTDGKKYALVDAFIQWRIKDVTAYYKATSGNRVDASNLLAALLNKGLRDGIAVRSLQEIVSGARDEMMQQLNANLNAQTQQDLGIEVLDVRVKAVDLPEDLSRAVYSRMAAERAREAREHRSQGKEQLEGIKAEADRQKVVIEANAYSDAEALRGEGDAKASSIYAKAYSKDAEFYAFTRSLKAYTESFKQHDVLLLEPNSSFFRYLKDAKGR